jgi:hypothetical protein
MRLSLALGAVLSALLSVVPAAVPVAGATPAAPSERAPARSIAYTQWDGAAQWRAGTFAGTRVQNSRLVLADPAGTRGYAGGTYEQGLWDSPWVAPGFALTELIPSWSALTPGDTWLEVQVRARSAAGQVSSWDVMGRWTSGDRHTRRQTVSGQTDDLGKVNVDTWRSAGSAGVAAYQIRVLLLRRAGLSGSPSVDAVGAVASRLPSGQVSASPPGPGRGIVLDLPRYSQMVHRGHYPAWGSGGQAWCSPTSTSMVLGYYDALPKPTAHRWVPTGHPDPWVDYAARMTYDSAYQGTGNWAFNTAYAAPRVGKAFVTRLRSLREAESFIAAGIPLVASISFGSGELSGAPISASNGHLLVIVGFTRTGDVIVNDPASTSRSGVRRAYDRGEFENAWLPASGGTVYVIHDAEHPLPGGTHPNW